MTNGFKTVLQAETGQNTMEATHWGFCTNKGHHENRRSTV
jgi:hypothetical protein